MRPEKKAGVQLNEDEKIVFERLKNYEKVDLNVLKDDLGQSNKTWDKAVKGLTGKKVAKVEKTDAGLFIEVI